MIGGPTRPDLTAEEKKMLVDPAYEDQLRKWIRKEWSLRFAVWITQKLRKMTFGEALVFMLTLAEQQKNKRA